MEFGTVVVTGALAGMLAGALNGLIWGLFWRASWRPQTLALHLATIGAHLLAAIALSSLFWLSWGLTAIVSVAWWTRGLSFALLCWAALCVPLLVSQLLSSRQSGTLILKSALEWLITCALVGLACAWTWTNGR